MNQQMQAVQALLNNPKLLQQKFNDVKQMLRQKGITPQQAVQNLLNSGELKQQDYNTLRNIVNNFAGTNF